MASYALLLIYSGFSFDISRKYIGFEPIKNGDGNYFWSVSNSYGNMQFNGERQILSVAGDGICLSSFGLRDNTKISAVIVDGNPIDFEQKENIIFFPETIINKTLEIQSV